MRRPENCNIQYCGYNDPKSSEEIEFEILGLDTLIKKAQERISSLTQSKYLVDLAIHSKIENLEELFKNDN
jgi:hypothetical protein